MTRSQSFYWADSYVEKRRTPAEAISLIRPGQRVFIGSACGEPKALVKALSEAALRLSGLEIVRLMSRETTSLSEIADKTQDHSLNIRTIYLGSSDTESIARYMRFITPMNMSEVPGLFLSRKLPIHVALIQVAPPDDFGWLSLGVSVDITMAAAQSADLVIAQVNPMMPRTMGQSFIHVNRVHVIVEHEEPILSVDLRKRSGAAEWAGKHISRLIEDGSTLQMGLDAASQATIKGLGVKNDLGFHSQYMTDDIMHLYAKGVITNRKKTLFPGRVLTSMCMGSEKIFRYIDNNPMFYFRSSEYVNDPTVIALNDNLISISSALEVDLTGQVCTDSMVHLFYNGIAELSGKSIYQRVMELAQIAHPKFREELIEVAKSRHYIFADQLPPIQDDLIYLEGYKNQMALKNGKIAEFRPLLPSDEFAYRKFFYSLQERTIYSRFFYKMKLFSHELAQKQWASVDYHKNMSMIGQVRVGGRQEIVAIGSYADEGEGASRAEIAFVVREDFQGMGIASYLLSIMQRIAKQNNFTGFMATVLRENKAMLQVFKKRYPNAKTSIEAGNYVNILMDFSDAVEHGHMVSSDHPIENDICICPVSKEKK